MTEKDMIMMSEREMRRVHFVQQVLDKKITQQAAAGVLELSDRQIRRIVKRIRKEGERSICHRGRGKASNQRIARKVKKKSLPCIESSMLILGPHWPQRSFGVK